MKNYVKPELFFEDFELIQNIASGCSSDMISSNFSHPDSCTISVAGSNVFTETNRSCVATAKDNPYVCYFAGTGAVRAFSS